MSTSLPADPSATGSVASRNAALRLAALGFLAGAIAVPAFHQLALAGLDAAGFIAAKPYAAGPVAPFGLPQIVSTSFWGGVWGIALAFLLRNAAPGARYWTTALLFGAFAPSLVAWLVVAPLKGLPLFAGGDPKRIATALLVNAAWGVGAALLVRLLGRALARPPVVYEGT